MESADDRARGSAWTQQLRSTCSTSRSPMAPSASNISAPSSNRSALMGMQSSQTKRRNFSANWSSYSPTMLINCRAYGAKAETRPLIRPALQLTALCAPGDLGAMFIASLVRRLASRNGPHKKFRYRGVHTKHRAPAFGEALSIGATAILLHTL